MAHNMLSAPPATGPTGGRPPRGGEEVARAGHVDALPPSRSQVQRHVAPEGVGGRPGRKINLISPCIFFFGAQYIFKKDRQDRRELTFPPLPSALPDMFVNEFAPSVHGRTTTWT